MYLGRIRLYEEPGSSNEPVAPQYSDLRGDNRKKLDPDKWRCSECSFSGVGDPRSDCDWVLSNDVLYT